VVRDVGDTTVQLSWSRGFDHHSPIAKYTLQARTPPAGKWKQVRTSKCEGPHLVIRPGCVQLRGTRGWRARAEPGASKRVKFDRQGAPRHAGRQESGESSGGGTLVCALKT
jgi:hypothetical protein